MQELTRASFHHIGFAVRSLSDTRPAFEALGASFTHEAKDEEQNLIFQFLEWGGVLVELISPCDPAAPCAVTKMVEKQPCTPYHICLEVQDLAVEIERLKGKGFRRMGKILASDVYGYPATGVFLFGRGIGVVELIQRC